MNVVSNVFVTFKQRSNHDKKTGHFNVIELDERYRKRFCNL